MGLDVPDLDDATFDELIEDARRRIPVYAEGWTDHNAHDPGITILELLAWLVETYGYQLDRVTDEHLEKYLTLLGASPRPPRPASIRLMVDPPAGSSGVRLPAGEPLGARTGLEPARAFETVRPVTLTEASLERVVSEHRRGRIDNSSENSTEGRDFLAFGERAEVGSALYLGFDGDPFEAAQRLDLTVSYATDAHPDPGSHGEASSTFEPSVELSWQSLDDYSAWHCEDAWDEMSVRADETKRFYRGGRVRLAKRDATGGGSAVRAGVLGRKEKLHWIRCVVTAAGYEVPPRVESIAPNVASAGHRRTVEDEQLRGVEREGDPRGGPGGDDQTTAHPGQTYAFAHAPVLAPAPERERAVQTDAGPDAYVVNDDDVGSSADADADVADDADASAAVDAAVDPPRIVVRRVDGCVSEPWTLVSDFDTSGPDDRHYVLDRARGTLRFGDGVRGSVPEPGGKVIAESYVAGGGRGGNMARSAEWFLDRDGVLGKGIYAFYSEADGQGNVRGALVVGSLPGEDEDATVEPDYGNWFSDGVETKDERDTDGPIEIDVRDDGFSPAAVRIDPGARVEFGWRADGHTVTVADRPVGGGWLGEPTPKGEGHVHAHTFNVVSLGNLAVEARTAAAGGRDAESVDAALARVRRELNTPRRAVTADDYETLTLATPGLGVARATAIVDADSDGDRSDESTEVRVVVVPHSAGDPADRPVPSEGFSNAVHAHLETRRLLTDRVVVDAPTYVRVSIDVELRIESGRRRETVAATVSEALEDFLHPLDGFDGDGWPFGRPVYRSELFEVIESQRGVDGVPDLRLRARGRGRLDADGNVLLGPGSLPDATDRDVTVRTDDGQTAGGGTGRDRIGGER